MNLYYSLQVKMFSISNVKKQLLMYLYYHQRYATQHMLNADQL